MNQSTKDSFGLSENAGLKIFSQSFAETKQEKIESKLSEAQTILSSAKERLKRMNLTESSFILEESGRDLKNSQKQELDTCLLACEMRTALKSLETQVKHLNLLSDQLLNPGYYRRNPYPHPYRLTKYYP